MFERPAAKPWCRPAVSATSEIRVIAGAKQRPAPSEVRTSAASTDPERAGDARRRASSPRRSPARPRRGCGRPTRSESRPAIGARTASSAAPAMKPAAITPWPPPRASIRSGTSTSIAPNITEGTRDEDRGVDDRPAAQRRADLAAALWRSGVPRLGQPRGGVGEAEGDDQDRAEDQLGADRARQSAQRRPEQGAGDRGAQRRADHRAAFLLRRRGDQPGQRPGPDQRPGAALDEAGRVEQDDVVDEAEGEAGDAEQQQAGDDRAPRADPAGDEARRQRGDQRAGGVGGGEDPGLRPCSARARRRSPAAAARSPRRRRRRGRPSPRRGGAAGACLHPISRRPRGGNARPLALPRRIPEGWQSG